MLNKVNGFIKSSKPLREEVYLAGSIVKRWEDIASRTGLGSLEKNIWDRRPGHKVKKQNTRKGSQILHPSSYLILIHYLMSLNLGF